MARKPTTHDPFNAIAEWIAPFARYWEKRFERLDELLERMPVG